MVKKGVILMSQKELNRIGVIENVIAKKVKQKKAAELLEISTRQVKRLVKVVRREGKQGLAHKNRGKAGNNKIPDKKKEKILMIYEEKYPDFGPTFASEKLYELDKLKVHHNTLRRWLLVGGDKHEWQRKKRPHCNWRKPRDYLGEMVQMDGSHHDWLEGRGPRMVLMGYVDDATGKKFGKFYMYEGTVPAMDSFKEYVKKHGVPMSVYLDRHSTYKTTRKKTIFEELNDKQALTQFERAMEELGVKVIHAHSAPAKGRVEKFFKTMQDRLVKELRLAKINTLEEANRFLEKYFDKYNEKYERVAAKSTDVHYKRPSKQVLESILCTKKKASLRKDSTVHYDNRVFHITNQITRRTKQVDLEEHLDGSIKIKDKNRYLKFKELDASFKVSHQEIVYKKKPVKSKKKKSSIPAENHPWKRHSPDYQIDSCDYEAVEGEEILSTV